MAKLPFALLRDATITRRTLLLFTLASAVINGLVTASVGAWLAQKYSAIQSQRQSINAISGMYYDRRIKAGMVASSLRRAADLDELKQRKRSYDESFVDWNRNIRQNLFAIREVLGDKDITTFEDDFQDLLVRPLSLLDACLTKAYDKRVLGLDGLQELADCKWTDLYQHALDCGAAYTNELYKMTRVSLAPWGNRLGVAELSLARQRFSKDCSLVPKP
jgi:hypothetical protein